MEIKFRGWKRNRLGDWVMYDWDEMLDVDIDNPRTRLIDALVYDEFELEQYSGMEDKNGVEIYEGDIAISCYGVGVVFRDERGFRFEFDTDTEGLWEMVTGKEGNDFVVIGNIHTGK